VSVTGKLKYWETDSSSAFGGGNHTHDIWEPAKQGTKITAVITLSDVNGRTYKETKTVTVQNDGFYTVKVPMIYRGTAVVKLYSEEFWEMTVVGAAKKQLWQHKLDQQLPTIYNIPVQTVNELKYNAIQKIQDVQ